MPGRGQRHDLRGVPVLVVENVQDYRDCVPHYVTKDDIVLEAGCAQGCTTAVLAEHAKEVVGIDKSTFNFGVAANRYQHIQFHEIAAEDVGALLKLGKKFTKIWLDISGSQPIGPLATLIEKYERAFPDVNLFVVKSYRLKKLVGCSQVYPEEVLGTTRNATTAFMLRSPQPVTAATLTNSNGNSTGRQHAADGRRPGSRAAGILRRVGTVCIALAAFGAGVAVGAGRRRAR